ncbi:MAG: hypothetical protein ACTHZ1_07090 [Sphingobacterium sp.]
MSTKRYWKKYLIFIWGLVLPYFSTAQDHNWAFGFFGDLSLEESAYDASFGLQGMYSFTNFQSVQAQFHGRGDLLAVGADYLVNLLNRQESNFNVFLGAGLAQEFFTYDYAFPSGEGNSTRIKENFTKINGQAGLSYYFPEVDLSLYTGYKVKYQFEESKTEPHFLVFGIRYHLW